MKRGALGALAAAALSALAGGSARAQDPPPGAPAQEPAPIPAAASAAIEVEVKGTLIPRAEDTTSASSVLAGPDLDRPGASSADLLARVPGARVVRTGGSADLATITLRGAKSEQTPVYLGSMLLNDELTGAADLSSIPPFFLRRIEVFRGHAPIELDRSGLGGAVVLSPFVPGGTRAGFGLGFGSFGERHASLGASAGDEQAAGAIAVSLDETRGNFEYRDDNGTRFDESDDRDVRRANADARSVDAWTAGRLGLGDRGALDLLVRVFAREQGVPGLGVLPARSARAATRKLQAALGGSVSCSATVSEEECRIALSWWGSVSSYRLDDPAGELMFSTARQQTGSTGTGSRLAFISKPAPWLEIASGASTAIDHVSVDPIGPAEARVSRSFFRAFLSALGQPVEGLDLRLEGAVASDFVRAPEGSVNHTSPTVRLGVAVRPHEVLALFATGARYVRVPTLGEQFGVSATVSGNPALLPETGLSVDVGARAEGQPSAAVRLAAEVVFFARAADDLVAYQRSSFGTIKPFNVGSARVLGVEGTALGRFGGWLELGGSLAWTDPRDVSDDRLTVNDRLPLESPLVITPTLRVSFEDILEVLRWDAASVEALLLYRSPRNADPAGLIELPSQVLLELGASLMFAQGTLEVAGRVSNLLDDQTTDLVGYPLPGRAGHLTMSTWWK